MQETLEFLTTKDLKLVGFVCFVYRKKGAVFRKKEGKN